MAASNQLEKRPVAGIATPCVAAVSNYAANAVCSVLITGALTAEVMALTQMVVTSTGATAAACVTLTISGISTQQISGNAVSMVFGVPVGAGVPAVPLTVNFDPPLLSKPGGTIKAQMDALGAGHVGAHIVLGGKVLPSTPSS